MRTALPALSRLFLRLLLPLTVLLPTLLRLLLVLRVTLFPFPALSAAAASWRPMMQQLQEQG